RASSDDGAAGTCGAQALSSFGPLERATPSGSTDAPAAATDVGEVVGAEASFGPSLLTGGTTAEPSAQARASAASSASDGRCLLGGRTRREFPAHCKRAVIYPVRGMRAPSSSLQRAQRPPEKGLAERRQ